MPTLLTREDFPLADGAHHAELTIPKLVLTPGTYILAVFASADGECADFIEYACKFDVLDSDFYGTGKMVGNSFAGKVVLCEHSWAVD